MHHTPKESAKGHGGHKNRVEDTLCSLLETLLV